MREKMVLKFAVVFLGLIALNGALISVSPRSVGAENSDIWVDAGSSVGKRDILQLPSFAPVIKQLGPSVVNISTESEIKDKPKKGSAKERQFAVPNGRGQFPFEFFFGMPDQSERKFETLGSGFVISRDGYIITNNHVVEKATKVFVTFQDEKERQEAEIVGRDGRTDLALLKLKEARDLEPAVLGDSDALLAGDWVIAIGNPYRLDHTATVGVVSALSRKMAGGGPYDNYIQTDANINPGNSGGPLFNARGEVVGVNTAIYRDSGANVGIGFAIPINLVKSIVRDLHHDGKVTRGWLGVLIQPISPEVAQALDLSSAEGALVAQVMKDSPADKAGIQRGDIIVSYEGKKISENSDLPILVAQSKVGANVDVIVERQKKKLTIKVKIVELEDEGKDVAEAESDQQSTMGLTVQSITPDISRALDLESDEGVVVAEIEPGTSGEESGLVRGDVIIEVNSKVVNSPDEFAKEMTEAGKTGKPILLLVRRSGNTVFLTVQPEKS